MAAALCKSASVESLVSLLGSVAGIPSFRDHCDARHSGFTSLEHLRKRLAGNRWRQVSVMSLLLNTVALDFHIRTVGLHALCL